MLFSPHGFIIRYSRDCFLNMPRPDRGHFGARAMQFGLGCFYSWQSRPPWFWHSSSGLKGPGSSSVCCGRGGIPLPLPTWHWCEWWGLCAEQLLLTLRGQRQLCYQPVELCHSPCLFSEISMVPFFLLYRCVCVHGAWLSWATCFCCTSATLEKRNCSLCLFFFFHPWSSLIPSLLLPLKEGFCVNFSTCIHRIYEPTQ